MPCDSNRRPPTFRSDCVKHCMFAHGDHLQRCFLLQPDNKKTSRMPTSAAWVVGRWAQVTAKSHSLRYATGSPASARHARADVQHRRSQYESLFKDTAPSPPHQKARAPRCRGARANLPGKEACTSMFAGNTWWLLGHMEECTGSGSGLDHPGQKPKFALEMDNATDR